MWEFAYDLRNLVLVLSKMFLSLNSTDSQQPNLKNSEIDDEEAEGDEEDLDLDVDAGADFRATQTPSPSSLANQGGMLGGIRDCKIFSSRFGSGIGSEFFYEIFLVFRIGAN